MNVSQSLSRLVLSAFRSYAVLRFEPGQRRLVFVGDNGVGKTNLLEAVSLLVPGRGLRGARFSDLTRQGSATGWAVAARFDDGLEIGTGAVEGVPERREFRLNGVKPRTQSEVAAQFAAVWLTPQMDRLFTDAASGRRKFLDRLVIALEPTHAREIAAFESAAAQRNRLLALPPYDLTWLSALEDTMARHAVAATAARLTLIARLNEAVQAGAAAPFPPVRLGLSCMIAQKLAQAPALDVEEQMRAALRATREVDAQSKSAGLGPQKADLQIASAKTGQLAAQASTGQQKAMLVGIILGHAAMITAARGGAPVLLLDEPLVHLDAVHRQALFMSLARADLPAWITGTDLAPFKGLDADAYNVKAGEITFLPSALGLA